jgi:hypothetical protein
MLCSKNIKILKGLILMSYPYILTALGIAILVQHHNNTCGLLKLVITVSRSWWPYLEHPEHRVTYSLRVDKTTNFINISRRLYYSTILTSWGYILCGQLYEAGNVIGSSLHDIFLKGGLVPNELHSLTNLDDNLLSMEDIFMKLYWLNKT